MWKPRKIYVSRYIGVLFNAAMHVSLQRGCLRTANSVVDATRWDQQVSLKMFQAHTQYKADAFLEI